MLPEVRVHMLVPLLRRTTGNTVVKMIRRVIPYYLEHTSSTRVKKLPTALTLVLGRDTVLVIAPNLRAYLPGLKEDLV